MRKINLKDYSFEIEDEKGDKKDAIYNVKDSLAKILLKLEGIFEAKELLYRNNLVKRLKECKGDEISLEEKDYSGLKEIIEKANFKREDAELIRRILEAEESIQNSAANISDKSVASINDNYKKKVVERPYEKPEHPKIRKKGSLRKKILIFGLSGFLLYQGGRTLDYYNRNYNGILRQSNNCLLDCINSAMQGTIVDVKNAFNYYTKGEAYPSANNNKPIEGEVNSLAVEKFLEENSKTIENAPVEELGEKINEEQREAENEEEKAKEREIEERKKQIDDDEEAMKVKGLLHQKANIEKSYGEKINHPFAADFKYQYETILSKLEGIKQENPRAYEAGKRAYEGDPLKGMW